MPTHTKNKPPSFALALEEWDFRNLLKDTDLQTLIEYEYLRSSDLRQVIVDWHRQDFRETQYTNIFGSVKTQREAGFLEFEDDSPLGRLCQYYDDSESLTFEEAENLETEARAQKQRLPRPRLSISEAIGRLFERIKNRHALEFALLQLGNELPPKIKEFNADKIALRFDRFPEPWVKIQKHDPEYLSSRCASAPHESPAMWKIWDPAEARNIGENPFFRKDCFIIDASRSQSDIVKDFTSWLNEWHAGGHPGRRIAVGWLQKFSAYRCALGDGAMDLDAIIMALYLIGHNCEGNYVTPEPLGPGGNPYPAMFGKSDPAVLDRMVTATAVYFREREKVLLGE